ncbi:MAG: phenylacetate-CoA oxygenase subunit PaaI [Planctomycetota bacterium]|nr:phenylacetate-CoA oxygenase subunit PaaI [Planctomycetota bacterium]
MPQTRTIRTRTEMDQAYFDTLVQLIRSQGYRELAAATVFAEALHLVPTIKFKKKVVQHIDEEMEHFEACCILYDSIDAGDLDQYCSRLLREQRPIPAIGSFMELGVAQFLYDRASGFQLREYENSSFDPYCRIIGKILEEEEGHESFGAEIMIEHCRTPEQRSNTQRYFNKWLAVSLRSFGRPQTAGNRYAISAGLKTRDSSGVAQDYVDSLKTAMRVSGLVFPDRACLHTAGTETAADIDLSL